MADDFKKIKKYRMSQREKGGFLLKTENLFFSNNKTEEYLLKNKMQLLANEIKTKVITK